jgi:hypothetical protein
MKAIKIMPDFTLERKIKMKAIKIMPDFTSSGIWDYKTRIMIDETDKSLDLPVSIQKRLRYWNDVLYEKCYTKNYAERKEKSVWNKLNQEGFLIASEIKELKPELKVFYIHEVYGHCVEVEIKNVHYYGRRT